MSADEGVMSIGLLYREKAEREKQIYINTYMQNLEEWYRWSYLQSRNRDTDVENKCMNNMEEKRVGWSGRLGLTYIHYYV